MPAQRSAGTVRSLILVNAIFATAAFIVPAFGQVETIVVTAERKSEDLQTVPIAITALSADDLHTRQVTNYRDLQFNVPGLTFSKTQFGTGQFTIRGVSNQIGVGAAVGINEDDIYLELPNTVSGEFYDIERIEVLEGPQSTSYGKATAGGVVNIITAKPNLDTFMARASVNLGTFDQLTPDAMINIPIITGQLGLRVALHANFHQGYSINDYNFAANTIIPSTFEGTGTSARINGLGEQNGRATLRWEPSDNTTVDFVVDYANESDTQTRADKILCNPDPTGVLGCLPFGGNNTYGAPNQYANQSLLVGSKQGLTNFMSMDLWGPAIIGSATPNALASINTAWIAAQAIAIGTSTNYPAPFLAGSTINYAAGWTVHPNDGVGLVNIAGNSTCGAANTQNCFAPHTAANPIGSSNGIGNGLGLDNPASPNVVDSFMDPVDRRGNGLYLVNWTQNVFDWLKSAVDVGYNNTFQFMAQPFQALPAVNLDAPDYTGAGATPASTSAIRASIGAFDTVFDASGSAPAVGPAYGSVPLAPGQGPFVHSAYDAAYFGGIAADTNNATGPYTSCTTSGINCTLPLSNLNYAGAYNSEAGIINNANGGVLTNTSYNAQYDLLNASTREWTGEARFTTDFQGPLNFTFGAFYESSTSEFEYMVGGPEYDWDSAILGAFVRQFQVVTGGLADPILLGTTTNDPGAIVAALTSSGIKLREDLISRSAFLEGTYEIIPDELKLIIGARYDEDRTNIVVGLNPVSVIEQLLSDIGPVPTAGVGIHQSCAVDLNAPLSGMYVIGSNFPTCQNVTFLGSPGTPGTNDGDAWTGRGVVEWQPKFSFTDQTAISFTAARGVIPGANQVENSGGSNEAPAQLSPAFVNELDLDIKNTLLNNTLTADLDTWYYNYQNYQFPVVSNGAFNALIVKANIPAHLFGETAQLSWAPLNNLSVNMSLSVTEGGAGDFYSTDPRDPLNGIGVDAVYSSKASGSHYPYAQDPNPILIKDVSTGNNCVLIHTYGISPVTTTLSDGTHVTQGALDPDMASIISAPNYATSTPGDDTAATDNSQNDNVVTPMGPASAFRAGTTAGLAADSFGGTFHVLGFYDPSVAGSAGGNASAAALAGDGIPLVNFGICPSNSAIGLYVQKELWAMGFAYVQGVTGKTGKPAINPADATSTTTNTSLGEYDAAGNYRDGNGFVQNLHGNQLPSTPAFTFSLGAQYSYSFGQGFTLVPRLDYYWKSASVTSIFGDQPDRVPSWDTVNAQLQLNSSNKWYARAYVKNIFDKRNTEGESLNGPTQALSTNVFLVDPRIYGVEFGASW